MGDDFDNQKKLDEDDTRFLLHARETNPEAAPTPLDSLYGYTTEELVDVTLSTSMAVQRARVKELADGLGIGVPIVDYDDRCKLESAFQAIRDLAPTDELERNFVYNYIAMNGMTREALLRSRKPRIDQLSADRAAALALKSDAAAVKNAAALDRMRNRGKQHITVQHVAVHGGAQAVVGDVDARKLIHAGPGETLDEAMNDPASPIRKRKPPKAHARKTNDGQ